MYSPIDVNATQPFIIIHTPEVTPLPTDLCRTSTHLCQFTTLHQQKKKKHKRKKLKKWRVRILTLWCQWVCQFSLSRKLSFQSFTLLRFFSIQKLSLGKLQFASRVEVDIFVLYGSFFSYPFWQEMSLCNQFWYVTFKTKFQVRFLSNLTFFVNFHQCLIESKSKDPASLLTFTLSNSTKAKTSSTKKTRWGPLHMMCSVMIHVETV